MPATEKGKPTMMKSSIPALLAAALVLSACDSEPAKPAGQASGQGTAAATATAGERALASDEVQGAGQITAIKPAGDSGFTVTFESNNGAVSFDLPASAKTLETYGGRDKLMGKWVTVYYGGGDNHVTYLKVRPAP